jgi:type I restriction enzyme R subunit
MLPQERGFEDEVAAHLVDGAGHNMVSFGNRGPRDFDPALGLDPSQLFAFLEAAEPDELAQLQKLHGGNPEAARKAFLSRLTQELDKRGVVDVLRHGVIDLGVTLKLAFFKPAHGLTPELVARYDANRLTVVRQFAYSADESKTIDVALLVNGIPVATAELKNPLTGQGVGQAIDQYRRDRDPNNLTLAKRALVHFAVDPERIAMTTRLAGASTRFLPFNLGHDLGAGNPPNPDGHRTAYLWERVWQRDNWLDLLARFIHVDKDVQGRPRGIIFPRFHQWDAVLKLEADAREKGAGQSYLVQHSAGSGKSNTIAWLAHRLMSLHRGDDRTFDKVVVITDRVILDRQLQDTIYQFEHAYGVVQKIDESSAQLAEALKGEQARIIITTLQKFPFVIDKIAGLPARRYAVIVDEAHSSQTGEAARDLKVALGAAPETALEVAEREEQGGVLTDLEDLLATQVQARARQPNLSFFAFTATPKARTLELFGNFDEAEGQHVPFHLYSMRQAIEEGFILDVLQAYTTYKTYWKVQKEIRDDPRYEVDKARQAIASHVSLHPTMLAQKAEIIIEHFRDHVADQIAGRAKAMVVTSSRLHAVKYKLALDDYINQHGYRDVRTLVAFSGRVYDGTDNPFSEANMNALPESQTATAFASDEYQVLVVAEKFQTGFDQPLLHTMYVDKVLSGLAAVQTLSRLNRIHPDKNGTFVLDFRNQADDIRHAFEPYHGMTAAVPTDPNAFYTARLDLDDYDVLRPDEIAATVKLLAGGAEKVSAAVYAALAPAVERFNQLEPLRREEFRDRVGGFIRIYSFLSQVVNFQDTGMERDYIYCRALAALVRRHSGGALDLGGEVELTHLHQALTFSGRISLEAEGGALRALLNPSGERLPPEEAPLSAIVKDLNQRYGLNLTEAHRLHLEAMAHDLVSDAEVQQEASANSFANFSLEFDKRFSKAITKEMRRNEEFSVTLLNDDDLRRQVGKALAEDVYARARVAWQRDCPIGELLEKGEGAYLEYKSSLEWDMREERQNKLLRTATIKTIAAFLNSRFGGTLVLGVADKGQVVGLDHDMELVHKEDHVDADRFQNHLTNLVKDAVGIAAATKVTTEVARVDGHDICRVHAEPSGFPVPAEVTETDGRGRQSKARRFFVRLNGSSIAMSAAEEEKYVQDRWGAAVAEPRSSLPLVAERPAPPYGASEPTSPDRGAE